MKIKGIIICIALTLVFLLAGSFPAIAQGPSLADIESEIDAVQWGIIYHPKEGCEEYVEAVKMLIVLEIADKFVEFAMVEYAETGELTGKVNRCLNRAVNLLERAQGLVDDSGFDTGVDIDKGVDAEINREDKLDKCGWLSEGDTPWDGASMSAYSNCTDVSSCIDIITARINLWLS